MNSLARWAVLLAAVAMPVAAASAQSYLDRLDAAEPAAAALLASKAPEWLRANAIVKDRLAFAVFAKPFPKRSRMSPNDLVACMDKAAAAAEATTRVDVILRGCTQ
jgi:hypothetical protein